jgi:hypothetical protein
MIFAACKKDGLGDGTDDIKYPLTIIGIPEGSCVVYAIDGNPSTVKAFWDGVDNHAYSIVISGGRIEIDVSEEFIFNPSLPNGIYTLVMNIFDGLTWKKATGVAIPGTVHYDEFTAMPLE